MAAIKVHGNPLSTATQRVLATLYEKEFEFEFVTVNMGAGEHKKEPFISLNPFGQVPAFEHGDLKLFGIVYGPKSQIHPEFVAESRAISQYIAHENPEKGPQLLCQPGKKMAIVTVWMEVEAQQFDPAASKLNWEQFYKPFFGLTTDPTEVEENEAKLAKVLDVYELRLAKSKYLACDCFTLADLHHLPNLQLLLLTPSKKLIESRPQVSAWAADITARPAWAKVRAMQKQ